MSADSECILASGSDIIALLLQVFGHNRNIWWILSVVAMTRLFLGNPAILQARVCKEEPCGMASAGSGMASPGQPW